MEISIRKNGDEIKAKITGPIKDSDGMALREAFDEMLEAGQKKVFIDLTYVPTINSLGIGKLLGFYRRLKAQQREVIIDGIHENLYSLFTSIHLHKLLNIQQH